MTIMIVYLLLLMSLYHVLGEYELKQVQIVFRHGDRAPTYIFPTDRNQLDKWPYGIGQLTEQGIRQQYNLGLLLRRQYKEFLGPILRISDIYVRSTDNDRTLMSAEANLAGFVYNDSYQIIPGLAWRPIAIHTVPTNTDYLLEFFACRRYMIEIAALYKLEYFVKKLAPYNEVLLQLRQLTGYRNLTFQDMWKVYDTLFCEKAHNLTVEEWVTPKMWTDIVDVNRIFWEIMVYKDMAKLIGGLLLYTITNNMTQLSQNKTAPKVIMYSGHDSDVAPLAKLLGFYNDIQPPYASCIIFELYHNLNSTDPWSVRLLFKNDSQSSDSKDFRVQRVTGCSSDFCPLSLFISVTKDKSMSREQFLSECTPKTDITIYVVSVFVFVCVGLFLYIVTMFYVRRRRHGALKYSRVGGHKDIN